MSTPITFSVAPALRSGSFFPWGTAQAPNEYPGGYSTLSFELDIPNASDYENAANGFTAIIWCSADGGQTYNQYDAWTWQGGRFISRPGTTIASGSNNKNLPQSTINVANASAFPASGQIAVNINGVETIVAYTGTTATSFTGCTGGSGKLATGQVVLACDPPPQASFGLGNLPAGSDVYIEIDLAGTYTVGVSNGVVQ
jgi:hypothetical protein